MRAKEDNGEGKGVVVAVDDDDLLRFLENTPDC